MKKQLIEKIENELKSEKIEYCCSNDKFNNQIEEIQQKYKNLNADELDEYLNVKHKEFNQKIEPLRTQIAYTNFLMVDILKLFITEQKRTLSTEEIHNIDTESIENEIKGYLESLKSLNINSSQFSASKLNKKIKQSTYTIMKTDKVEIQKDKKQKKRDQIFKAIKYLSAYNILQLQKVKNEKHNNYVLNLENWCDTQRYSLYNTDIFEDIIILLIPFLKYTAPNKVDDFLSHIDNIIDFLYTPPFDYETYSNIENHIIEQHILNESITFETFDKDMVEKLGDSAFKEVEIVNISIDENRNKTLRFKKDNLIYEIDINKIFRIQADENEQNSVHLKSKNSYVVYNDTYKDHIKNKNYPKQKEQHKILLEADTNMLRFFETKPLRNQKIYKTRNDKINLMELENLKIDTNNSKIYITAIDEEERIFNVVQKGMPHIKIMSPKDLNHKFKDYLKDCLERA